LRRDWGQGDKHADDSCIEEERAGKRKAETHPRPPLLDVDGAGYRWRVPDPPGELLERHLKVILAVEPFRQLLVRYVIVLRISLSKLS
jgi:hypothetical protein